MQTKENKQVAQGERLKAVRSKLNLTQKELAAALGYKYFSAIANLEAGDNKISIDVLGYLSEQHQVNPDYIILGEGLMFKPTAEVDGIHGSIQALVDCYSDLPVDKQGFLSVSLKNLLASVGVNADKESETE